MTTTLNYSKDQQHTGDPLGGAQRHRRRREVPDVSQ